MSNDVKEQDDDDELLEGEPTVHEIIEFSMAISLDLENSLNEEDNPFENIANININAGHLLYLCYVAQDMYQALEDWSDEDMSMLEQYVKTKKHTPSISNLKH